MISSFIPFMGPQLIKPLLYYVVLKINNCAVKNIFIVCLLLLGEQPRHEYLLHVFNNLYVCLTFNTCLVSNLLGMPYKFYVG